jgi:hypothetical protein
LCDEGVLIFQLRGHAAKFFDRRHMVDGAQHACRKVPQLCVPIVDLPPKLVPEVLLARPLNSDGFEFFLLVSCQLLLATNLCPLKLRALFDGASSTLFVFPYQAGHPILVFFLAAGHHFSSVSFTCCQVASAGLQAVLHVLFGALSAILVLKPANITLGIRVVEPCLCLCALHGGMHPLDDRHTFHVVCPRTLLATLVGMCGPAITQPRLFTLGTRHGRFRGRHMVLGAFLPQGDSLTIFFNFCTCYRFTPAAVFLTR